METIQMLIIVTFLFVASGRSNPFFASRSYRWFPTPQIKNVYGYENKNCACFKRNLPSVTDVLAKGANIERLVVYLYKNLDSGVLQLFAPNKDMQDQFPDLGFTDGNLFQVGPETIEEVFKTFHTVVKTSNSNPEVRPINSDIEPVYNPWDYNQGGEDDTTIHDGISDDGAPNDKDTNDLSYLTSITNEDQSGSLSRLLDEKYVNPHKNIAPKVVASLKQDSETLDFHDLVNQDLNGYVIPEGRESLPVLKLPLVTYQTNSKTLPNGMNYPYNNYFGPTSPEDPESDAGSDSAEVRPSSNTELDYSNTQTDRQSDVSYFNSKYFDPDKDLEDDDSKNFKGAEPSTSGSKSLHTIAIDDYLPSHIGGSGTDLELPKSQSEKSLFDEDTGNEYITFDKWFTQQMQKIRAMGRSPNKNINMFSLKNLIEKTLYENGLYVTMDGVLTDSKANALNVTNLKLRPFLIGDSVAYDNLLENKGKYELPSNLQYLESVLVTLVHPPKILGVIPLGKTLVPRTSYRTGVNYRAWKARNNTNACGTNRCKAARIKHYHQDLNAQNTEQFPQYVLDTIGNTNTANVVSHSKNKKKSTFGPDKNKYDYRLSLNNVLEAVQSALLTKPVEINNRQAQPTNKLDYPWWYKSKLEGLLKTLSSSDNEEDLPGFRIIGGYPATSSGTPVSNKGRNGRYLTYYNLY